ncbi:MAG: hypothetical protein IJM30_10040 [Thermoguttaceae bacterium]|nr:hypothetical protein [Thermoguttaceae bacterium]
MGSSFFSQGLFGNFSSNGASKSRDKSKRSLKTRSLRAEPLEDRQLLSATPYETGSELVEAPIVAEAFVAEEDAIDLSSLSEAETPLITEAATTFTVTSTGDSATTSGTLRYALANAADGAKIYFDPSLDGKTISVGSTLTIDKSVTIDASALSNGITLDGGGAIGIMSASANVATLKIANVTFANGTGSGGAILFNGDQLEVSSCEFVSNANSSGTTTGGAIYVPNGDLGVLDSSFSDNSATTGGAIHIENGDLRILNSTFEGNSSIGNLGGAVYSRLGNIFVDNSSFVNNSTPNGNVNAYGGAIYHYGYSSSNYEILVIGSSFKSNGAYHGGAIATANNGSTLKIYNSAFNKNNGQYSGGALHVNGSLIVDANCSFTENTAQRAGAISASGATIANATFTNNKATNYYGGAIEGTNNSIANSTFKNNSAARGGAIDGSGSIDDSSFIGNSTTTSGGAANFTGRVYNSIFKNNTARSYGGALYCYSNDDLQNNLFVSNSADSRGGAVYYNATTSSNKMEIRNSSFVDNASNDASDLYVSGGTSNVYNSILGLESSAVSKNPNVTNLYGYNNLTSFTDWTSGSGNKTYSSSKSLFTNASGGNYSLPSGSQAVNAGNNDYVSQDYDLAGNSRIYGSAVDIGAYEYVASSSQTTLSTPTLTSGTLAENYVVVKIGAVSNASQYVVEYSESSSFTNSSVQKYDTSGSKTINGLKSGTKYYFRVKAEAPGYNDSAWKSINATTKTNYAKLATPNVSNAPSTNSIALTIGSVANANLYVVEYSTSSSFSTSTTKAYSSSGSKTISGLTANKTYYFRVKAVAAGYRDSDWTSFSATTGSSTQQLATPTLTKGAITSSSVTVTIGSVANATGYTLQYSTSSTFSTKTEKPYTSAGAKTIDGLSASTTYYFRVMATASGYTDSDWSTKVTATTLDDVVVQDLDAPDIVGSTTNTAIVVNIAAVSGATGYSLQYATNSSFTNATTKTYSSSGAKTISGLTTGTTYYVRVKATATGSESPYSETLRMIPGASKLAAPTVSTTSYSTQIVVGIAAVDNASTYVLEYADNAAFANKTRKTYTTSGAKTFSGLASGTTYYFRVKAQGTGYNDSAWNAFDAATNNSSSNKLSTPTLSVSSKTANSVTLAIGSVANATNYTVQYSTSSSFASTTSKSYSTAGSKTITGLTPATTYYFRVKATASGYTESNWSSLVSATTNLATPTLTKGTVTSNSAVVTIGAVDKAETYTLEFATNSSFTGKTTKTYTSAGAKTIAGLSPATDYYFRVKASATGYDASAWSTTLKVTTLDDDTETLATPTLAKGAVTSSTVKVTIGSVASASKYTLEYATNSSFTSGKGTKTYTSAGTKTIDGLSPSTTYYFRVKASATGYNDSAWSSTVSAKTSAQNLEPLAKPTIALSATHSAIVAKIDPVDGAEKYVLDYSTDSTFSTYTEKTYASSGTKTISGLAQHETYYVRVKATATDRADSAYATGSAYTCTDICPMPAISVDAVKTAIVVKINEVEFADKYVLEYSENEDFSDAKTKTYSTPGAKTISGLTFGTKYYIRVKATSSVANPSRWNEISYRAGQLRTPAHSFTTIGTDSVKVKCWNSPNASGFEVQYSTSADFSNARTVQGPSSGVVEITGLSANTKYYFKARALGDNVSRVESNWTPSFSATTKEEMFPAPTVSSSVTASAVVLNISGVSHFTSVEVQYAKNSSFTNATTKAFTSLGAKTFSGLASGTTYYFRVRANYSDGTSNWVVLQAKTKTATSGAISDKESAFEDYFADELDDELASILSPR